MAGPVFEEVNYRIAYDSAGPEFGDLVNVTLLDLSETGALDDIRVRWFGTAEE